MVYVDNSQITPLYANTAPGNTADAGVVDPAIAALVTAINTNADIYTAFITALELPIPDQSIVTRHLRNLAVTNPKLAPLAVTADKIADGSITLAKLADLVVTAAKIANGTITETKYQTGSVSNRVLANQSVTVDKLDPSLIGPISDASIQAAFARVNAQLISGMINVKFPPPPIVGAANDGVTDDTAVLRSIIQYAESNNKGLFFPGVSVITGELEILKEGMIWCGIGAGAGYGDKALTNYTQISGLLVKGTGTARIRTRSKYRASASDPQDDALSVAVNIQAENVTIKDMCIFLDFDRTDNTPTNYGYNWDVGIFNGCRVHTTIMNVSVLGYWRQAAYMQDVTRSTFLPEFNDLNGNPYPRGTVTNGSDGLTIIGCYFHGGRWGIWIKGAEPKAGEIAYTTDYYDQILGTTVVDRRGNFGCSDFVTAFCVIRGTDHHTKWRRENNTGNYVTDPAGGCMYINGLAGNVSNMIQGGRHFSTRFSSWEPYRIRLNFANRQEFYGCHSEYGSGAFTTSGVPLVFDDTDVYGPISWTTNTTNTEIYGFNASLRTAFLGNSSYLYLSAPGSTRNNLNKGIKIGGDSEIVGALDISGSIRATSTELDLRSVTGSDVRLRSGSASTATIGPTYATFYAANAVRSSADNTASSGMPSNRWTVVYAATGTINTSDERSKQQIKEITDAVLDAWSEVNYQQFKFNDSVEQKGDSARWHIGVIAQEIEKAFQRHGLNAFDYGLLCYDEWPDEYEDEEIEIEVHSGYDRVTKESYSEMKTVKTGNKVLVKAAGNRYSIRPDECLMLESALLRRQLKRLESLLK